MSWRPLGHQDMPIGEICTPDHRLRIFVSSTVEAVSLGLGRRTLVEIEEAQHQVVCRRPAPLAPAR